MTSAFATSLNASGSSESREDTLVSLFKSYDTSGDGYISSEEFQKMFSGLNAGFSTCEVDVILNQMDRDGNGLVDYKEFAAWVYGEESAGDTSPKSPPPARRSYSDLSRSVTPSGRRSRKTQHDPYAWTWDRLCISEATERNVQCSKDIAALVRQSRLAFGQAGLDVWQQDPIYQTQDFNVLKRDGDKVKQRFDKIIGEVFEMLNLEMNSKGGAIIAESLVGTKNADRGEKKCAIKFGGDTSQMSDVVRGTIIVDGGIDDLYAVVKHFVTCPKFQSRSAHFTHFADRYQEPLGSYRDILTLVRINGHVCELQFNVKQVIDIKESKVGHGEYEKVRLFNDNLLLAVMKNQPIAAIAALREGATPNVKDGKHGLSALHFAAFHQSQLLVQHLLEEEADVYSVDNYGHMPLYRAMMKEDKEIVDMLLDKMDADELLPKLDGLSGPKLMCCAEMAHHQEQTAVADFLRPVVEKALAHKMVDVRIAAAMALEAMGAVNEVDEDLRVQIEAIKHDSRVVILHDMRVVEDLGLGWLQTYIKEPRPLDLDMKNKNFPCSEEVCDIVSRLIARHERADMSRNERFFDSKQVPALEKFVKTVEHSTTLISLILSRNNLGPDNAMHLACLLENNTSLTSFNVSVNNIGDAGGALISAALRRNTKSSLKTVDIGRNRLEERTGTALANLMKTNVTLLDIKWSFEDDIGNSNEEFVHLRLAANKWMLRVQDDVSELDLSNLKLSDSQLQKVTDIIKHSHVLDTLIIDGNHHLDETDGVCLADATRCNGSLKRVVCRHTNLGKEMEYRIERKSKDEIRAMIKRDKGMEDLRLLAAEVDLSYCRLDSADIRAISANLEDNPRTIKLNIRSNEMSEKDGQRFVSAIENNFRLEEVSVEECYLSPKAEQAIENFLQRNKKNAKRSSANFCRTKP
eukprot:gnl/MRDRNA2_/MRDRNA2_112367_c0_seq1.p1 gnl/MRDRNA2_/MRDRNA2_112367_c0~~gnl/MRDRNA2_/MRDRNA2_112367_c0_seq1.p1  ORF type:complete len:917 (-),score=150.59 gnl/MRDRNA2_/MRDRNA2_112367_c0_seq1:293-3043(-)